MLEYIKIHNFRCFDRTRIENFSKINLIGGKNNSGKTALLEALYLICSPVPSSIMSLMRFRRESAPFLKAMPEKAWDNLFFNQNKESAIEIDSNLSSLEISCDNSVEDFLEIMEEENDEKYDNEIKDDLRETVSNIFSDSEFKRSTLHLNLSKNDKLIKTSLIAHSRGIMGKSSSFPSLKKANFIPSSFMLSSEELAEEFDKADLGGNAERILEILQAIDGSISQIKTFNIGKPKLYLKREEQKLLPASLFGEAVSKVIQFALKMVNEESSILLIDEIENGLHYSNQQKLWELLFKLANEFDVQIFATTHSLEMIKAFCNAALQKENNATYFELIRNIRTQKISYHSRDIEALNYALERDMEVRGE
jgi:AAA15 family ATPase/GTPase